jgi:uncharacterized protein with HEPN domain
MSNNEKDLYIVKKIVKYCSEADQAISHFDDSPDALKSNSIFKNAAAMCVLQIGELVGHLSDDFINKHADMPWRQIKGMRNRAAHGYEDFDVDILWQTLKGDLPALHDYCNDILRISMQ